MTTIATKPAESGASPSTSSAERADEVLAKIAEIGPLLAKNAVDEEKERRLSDETVAALTDAGAFRMVVPRRFGGLELEIADQVRVISAIAEVNGSASWVTVLYNQAGFGVATDSEQCQNEVFGADPDARVVGTLTPAATARPVPGGWRVSGRAYYNTGSAHATWVTVNAYLLDANGEVVGAGGVRTPIENVTIEDVWHVAGMRATASNCAVWDDVFVPDHHMVRFETAMRMEYATPFKDETVYQIPLTTQLLITMMAPQLGFGRAALRLVIEKSRKGIAYTHYEVQAESVAFQLQIARAATLVETAHLHVERAAELAKEWSSSGHIPTVLERGQTRAHASAALESITEALNILLFAHGAGSFAESNPLQRIWRDSATIARHAFTLPEINYEVYGKALLGIEEQPLPLI